MEKINLIVILGIALITTTLCSCQDNNIDKEKLSNALIKYDEFSRFSEGLAAVRTENGMWGYIDKSGKEIIPCIYTNANEFSEGLAAVRKENGVWGYIDKSGKEIFFVNNEDVSNFSGNLVVCTLEGSALKGLFNKKGENVVPFNYLSINEFSEGLAAVNKDDKWGYIDETGKEIIPCTYSNATQFSEGLAAVEKDDKWGYVDKTGKEVIPCIYSNATEFSEGLAAVEKDNKWGYVDKTGKEVIPCIYGYANNFSEGLAAVDSDSDRGKSGDIILFLSNANAKWSYIDKTGKEVISCNHYNNIQRYSEGLAAVKKDNKWGYIDKLGKEIIPCIYDGADDFLEDVACVKKGEKYGYIDKKGVEIAPCVFDRVWLFSNDLSKAELGDRKGYLDKKGYFIERGAIVNTAILMKKEDVIIQKNDPWIIGTFLWEHNSEEGGISIEILDGTNVKYSGIENRGKGTYSINKNILTINYFNEWEGLSEKKIFTFDKLNNRLIDDNGDVYFKE